MIKKLFISLFITLLFITPLHALNIPTQDQSYYVNDFSQVLSDSTKDELISINQTSDFLYGGYVVVATFDFVDEDLYDFSYKLFNQWGIGDENHNNGVLLVLDIGNDNYCYIMGTGIEKICSDYEARDIIDTYMEPDFAVKNYDEALLKTTNAFLDVIENGGFVLEDEIYEEDSSFVSDIFSNFFTIIIIIFVFSSILPAMLSTRGYHTPYGRTINRPYYRPMHHRPTYHRTNRPMGGGSFRGGSSLGGGRHHSGGRSRGAGGTRR